ncbi:hypothetical protein ABD87_23010 [Lysinibacillus sphaericus]|uniref:hypothetical protein n=1 Tax=Lysinibacillus sphaericus TaxID=1421 RepID=UPI0018CEEF68|nr:hypothetical protein [Lysinibacillus sphaericus]MBG9732297.1 hypothetical protein [Lysinibacillus sphaericus]
MLKKIKKIFFDDSDPVKKYLEELVKTNHLMLGDPNKYTFRIIEYLKFQGAKDCIIEVYQVPIKRIYHVDLSKVTYDYRTKFCKVETENDTFYISNDFDRNHLDSRSCLIVDNTFILKIDSSDFFVKFTITLPYSVKDMLLINEN